MIRITFTFQKATALCFAAISGMPLQATANQAQLIDVPQQLLAEAIAELGAETGFQIGISERVAQGKRSQSVAGVMSPENALELMLSGTGLVVQSFGPDGAVVDKANVVSQDAQSDALDLGTLVLRGELLDRSLQDSPTSAVIASGAELEARGDRELENLIDRSANVSRGGNISIRGVSQFGTGRGSSSPLISTQVDGVALPDTSALGRTLFPVWDVEQVEILRGPQSTQQGRNALGGAIIIRTRDPEYDNSYRIRLGAGNRNSYEAALSANQVLIQDKIALRFAAQTIQDDGFVSNPTLALDDFNNTDFSSWRAKVRFNPTDQLEVLVSYSAQDTVRGESRLDDSVFPALRINTADVPTTNQLISQTAGLRVSYAFSDSVRLETETTYYTDALDELIDPDRSSVNTATTLGLGDANVYEQDIQLHFDTDALSGVVGAFYLDSDFERRSLAVLGGGATLVDIGTRNRTENIALFGEVDINADTLLPGLSFTAGARYDYEDGSTTTSNFLNSTFVSSQTLDFSFEAFLPKIGTSYVWRPGLTTSFTYQRGYRAGGASFNFSNGNVSEFDPEFTDNFEFAIRGEFLDQRLIANANVFYTSWKDQQVLRQLSAAPGDTEIVNAGESEMIGAEVSVSYEATANLNFWGNLGYLHAEFVDFQLVGGANLAGNALPRSPEFTGAIGAEYRFLNGVSVAADATFTDATFSDASNTLRSGAYFLLNAQINYENGPFRVGLFVRNLLDEDYALNRFNGTASVARLVQSGEPRTFGAFVEYDF